MEPFKAKMPIEQFRILHNVNLVFLKSANIWDAHPMLLIYSDLFRRYSSAKLIKVSFNKDVKVCLPCHLTVGIYCVFDAMDGVPDPFTENILNRFKDSLHKYFFAGEMHGYFNEVQKSINL
jgi:hypothetical protein